MPYENQRATGESLILLQQSKLFKEFKGEIDSPKSDAIQQLEPINVPDCDEEIEKVIAIDGSLITEELKEGFPGAEASLVQIALVFIDLLKLRPKKPGKRIPPTVFNNMDEAKTLEAVLPGRNIVLKNRNDISPKDYFRLVVFEQLQGKIVAAGHETLLETYEHLMSSEKDEPIKCPYHELCGHRIEIESKSGESICGCEHEKTLYSTDRMRFHERFNEVGANGRAHGEVMQFLELILLINVLRYFVSSSEAIKLLPRVAFVLDGPLAAFGQFATLAPRVKKELRRISEECFQKTGKHILLFSLTKTGQFVTHFEQIDYDKEKGPDRKFPERTLLPLSMDYIHKAIVFRPEGASDWGRITYFGRVVLYKSQSGQRMVLNTTMVTDEAQDTRNISLKAYPRISEILKIVDKLSTYLFEGGFVPIVRAHSHAAIPFKLGGEILKSLFENEK